MRGRMKNMPEKKLRILYVEDDRSLAASLKLGLRRHAIELACAYTCREALQKMRSDVFDFYLIDVRLSDGNGFDLCRDIRETDRTPIIFLTGADGEREQIRGYELGNGWGCYDLGLQTMNLLLAATELGLGTLVMGIRDEKRIRELLSIPSQETIVSVIAVGYPDIDPLQPKRKSVTDITTYH